MVPSLVSYVQKLGIGKDILISSIRGFIQLLLLGFFISYLFSMEKWYVILGYILLMMIVASWSIAKRGEGVFHSFFIVLFSMFISVSLCIILWLVFSIIPFKAQYLISVGGMFTGTSMIASSVVLEAFKKFHTNGIESLRQESIKLAMIPSVDVLKTVGLVQIPGTMTGMILAGADPFEAVKYQIFILFSLLVITSSSAIIVSYYEMKYYKNKVSDKKDGSLKNATLTE